MKARSVEPNALLRTFRSPKSAFQSKNPKRTGVEQQLGPIHTSSEGLGQHLGREGGFGAAAAVALLRQVFSQHVPPPAVQEAVQDVRGDHVRQGAAGALKSRLESQSVCGQHRTHVA